MFFILSLISNSASLFSKPLKTVPSLSTTIGITVTLMPPPSFLFFRQNPSIIIIIIIIIIIRIIHFSALLSSFYNPFLDFTQDLVWGKWVIIHIHVFCSLFLVFFFSFAWVVLFLGDQQIRKVQFHIFHIGLVCLVIIMIIIIRGFERKNLKEYLKRTRKSFETKLYCRNLIKMINTWVVPSCKILGTVLNMDERRTSTNIPENKKTYDYA